MRRPIRIALALAAVIVIVGGVVLGRTIRAGFSTHDDPSAAEALVARAIRSWAVPAELRDATNPLPATPAVLAESRAHWADHCAVCHGHDGSGQTTIGQRLYPRAPDMRLPATQELSDGELFAIVENGIRLTGMPGWGDGSAQSGYGSWGLVHFVRRLPELTRDELSEMEALNPKSPEECEQVCAERAFLEGDGAAEPAIRDEAMPHQH